MKISAFNFSVTNVSATRMVKGSKLKEVLGLSDLPKTLHPLLQQSVISSSDLAPFEKLRKRVQEFLRKNGAWHELLGWITANNKAKRDEIIAFMDETSAEFYREKQALLSIYETRCQEHLVDIQKECAEAGFEHCSEVVELIRQAQPKSEYLEKKIQFSYLRPRIVEIHEDEEKTVITGLYGQALAEIQARAKRAVNAPRPKTLINAVRDIASKCESLSYIDQRYLKLSEEINNTLAGIPDREKNADYAPVEHLSLMGMLNVLSNTNDLDKRIKSGGGLFPEVDDDQIDMFAQDEDVVETNISDEDVVEVETSSIEPEKDSEEFSPIESNSQKNEPENVVFW